MNCYNVVLYKHSNGHDDLTLNASLTLNGSKLELHFVLEGAINQVNFPLLKAPLQQDDLWKTTCFECFIAKPDSDEYWEVNVSPSLGWNIYHFDAYRKGMKTVSNLTTPIIKTHKSDDVYQLWFEIEGDWQWKGEMMINLSAVINEKGVNCYWSTLLPNGQADFHDRQYFRLFFFD